MEYINENEKVKIVEKGNEFDKETVYSHSSWGLLQLNRRSSTGNQSLFGSSIEHQNTICLRIYHAEKHRHLNRDWYMDSRLPLIEIELSPAQFAEAITTLNSGCGTPCTIEALNGNLIKFAEETTKIEEMTKELDDDLKMIGKRCKNLVSDTIRILQEKGNVTKSDKETILAQITKLIQEVESNLPFVKESFDEQMEKTITEAKSEIEAFFISYVHNTGLEAIKGKMNSPELRENNNNE